MALILLILGIFEVHPQDLIWFKLLAFYVKLLFKGGVVGLFVLDTQQGSAHQSHRMLLLMKLINILWRLIISKHYPNVVNTGIKSMFRNMYHWFVLLGLDFHDEVIFFLESENFDFKLSKVLVKQGQLLIR